MELRDFVVTPILLMIIYGLAYIIYLRLSDPIARKYFFPGLTVKIAGALAMGLIYQFYYKGGDTFIYHTHGSRVIWEAFCDSPQQGLSLIFSSHPDESGLYKYTHRIWYFNDVSSYAVVRIAAFFDLFTFSTYSATAVLFSVFSFIGSWLMFLAFYPMARQQHFWIGIACFFIPTTFFWGSGILKDTITLAALGVSMYCIVQIFVNRRFLIWNMLLLFLMLFAIFVVKKYILLCFLPAIIVWGLSAGMSLLKSIVLRAMLIPVVAFLALISIYFTVSKVGEGDSRYNVNAIAETARITAYDIRYGWGARTGEGSGYDLGELDGSWQSMLKLAPAAINVSLFRPYIWEVKNPLMAISSMESFVFLMVTIFILYKVGFSGLRNLIRPEVMLCIGFAIVFAFAVGVSSYNFGTLSRYKIPLLPFYATGLIFLYHYSMKSSEVIIDESQRHESLAE